jgi:hypothetical protein
VQRRLDKQKELQKEMEEKLELLNRKIMKTKKNWDELTRQKVEDKLTSLKDPHKDGKFISNSINFYYLTNFDRLSIQQLKWPNCRYEDTWKNGRRKYKKIWFRSSKAQLRTFRVMS